MYDTLGTLTIEFVSDMVQGYWGVSPRITVHIYFDVHTRKRQTMYYLLSVWRK